MDIRVEVTPSAGEYELLRRPSPPGTFLCRADATVPGAKHALHIDDLYVTAGQRLVKRTAEGATTLELAASITAAGDRAETLVTILRDGTPVHRTRSSMALARR